IGFMWGIELVKDNKSNTPFPRKERVAERVWEALFQKGIIIYKATGLAGIDGDAIMIAPPYVIEDNEIDLLIESVGQALEETVG
nr:aspartate aminotransferase family protein [Bacteroidota bacterium]